MRLGPVARSVLCRNLVPAPARRVLHETGLGGGAAHIEEMVRIVERPGNVRGADDAGCWPDSIRKRVAALCIKSAVPPLDCITSRLPGTGRASAWSSDPDSRSQPVVGHL